MSAVVGYVGAANKTVNNQDKMHDRLLTVGANVSTQQSLFVVLNSFNAVLQSLYEESLVQCGLNHERYLVLVSLHKNKTINLINLLLTTDLSYGALGLVLENLEKSQLISTTGSKHDPESMMFNLTQKGKDIVESTQKTLNAAEKDVLKNLPLSGLQVKNSLQFSAENPLQKNASVEKDIKPFNDDLALEQAAQANNTVQKEAEQDHHDLSNFRLEADEVPAVDPAENASVEDSPATESKYQAIFTDVCADAAKNYPDSYSTQLYSIEEELIAYLEILKLETAPIPADIFNKIKISALEEEDSYEMQLYDIERNVNAYLDLQTLSPVPLTPAVFDKICSSVKDRHPENYDYQLDNIEDQIFAYAQQNKLFSVPEDVKERINVFAASEYPEDYAYQQEEKETHIRSYFNLKFRLPASDMPNDVLMKIHSEAKKEYPEDYSERFYEVRRQIISYAKLNTFSSDKVSFEIFERITSSAKKAYNTDFHQQISTIEENIQGYCKIENFSNSSVPDKKLQKIKSNAKNNYPDHYSWQFQEIKDEVSAYISKKDLRKVPSAVLNKINKNAEKEDPDDYAQQQREVNRQIEAYCEIKELTPEMFFNDMMDDSPCKPEDKNSTVIEQSVTQETTPVSEEVETGTDFTCEDQVAILSVLIDDEIAVLTKGETTFIEPAAPAPQSAVLKKWALNKLLQSKGVISLKEICDIAFGASKDGLNDEKLRQLAKALSAQKIGISPDPKFAFKQQDFSDYGVLFNLSFAAKTVEQEVVSDHYRTASLMLHLGMKAAQSDDVIVDAETDMIEKIVFKNPGLSASEKARLEADMVRLKQSKISLEFMASMLNGLSSQHKERMAHIAFRVVTSDNIIETSELNFLLWLYDQLGFDQEQLKQKINMISDLPDSITRNFSEQILSNILGDRTGDTEQKHEEGIEPPVSTVFEVEVMPNTYNETGKNTGLDHSRISELRHENESQSDLLQEIFSGSHDEEERETQPFNDVHDEAVIEDLTDEIGADDSLKIAGLDSQHEELLLSLLQQDNPDWNWFEMRARKCGLMVNGAMETLNEWGYDNYNDLILEADPFSFNEAFYSYLKTDESSEITTPVADPSGGADGSGDSEPEQKAENTNETDDSHKYDQFLEDLLKEEDLDADRFREMAASWGLTYDEAFALLQ